jgi:hypothetical protein
MPLARAVSDFTAIARSSLHEALGEDLRPAGPLAFCTASPQQVFVGHLSHTSNLRHSARLAGLSRPQAKAVLRRVSRAGIDYQLRSFAYLTLGPLGHRAAWAFSAKQRHASSSRRNRYDHEAVWSHVWVEETTGLIPRWLVGPSPPLLAARHAEAPYEVDEFLTPRAWGKAQPAGLARKINLHAQALAFFVLYHNFCRPGADGLATPAMLHAVAERPWTPREVAALAFEGEATRVSA